MNAFATNTLGFTGVAAGPGVAAVSATQQLGQTILAGTALIGGVSGIAQSARTGDPLGIVAGALEIAAAIAGGLISTNSLIGEGLNDVLKLAQGIQLYAGIGSTAASVADAFKNGDLAGGLAGSLNALLPLIVERVIASTPVQESPTSSGSSPEVDLPSQGGDGSNEAFPAGDSPYVTCL